LIVDDSALVRGVLTELLRSADDIEVVGSAPDAYSAREKIKSLKPDVLTLDVEMPRMDGVTFLRNLMRLHPMPVVMVSSLTEAGAGTTLDALSVGAVDYLSKPKAGLADALADYRDDLLQKVRGAADARVKPGEPPVSRRTAHHVAGALPRRTTDRLIAVGASTGGTEAIRTLLIGMPPDSPAIVIAQHIPKAFSTPFAERMNRCCRLKVIEAGDGQHILPGHAYIAPGDRHLLIARSGARWVCRLDDGPPVNRHKPSVDVLFRSVAKEAGYNAIGVILTGMGKDGAHRGCLKCGRLDVRPSHRTRPRAWCGACRERRLPSARPARNCRSNASGRAFWPWQVRWASHAAPAAPYDGKPSFRCEPRHAIARARLLQMPCQPWQTNLKPRATLRCCSSRSGSRKRRLSSGISMRRLSSGLAPRWRN
jgi:two-component system chemotaxis response regulator CheB